MVAVERGIKDPGKESLYFRLLAVPDCLDEKIAEGFPLELEPAEDIENLTPQRLPGLLKFFQKASVDVAFTCLLGDQIPEMADLGLSDTMDTPEALLDAVGIPGEIVINHQVRTLEVDPLPCRRRWRAEYGHRGHAGTIPGFSAVLPGRCRHG